MLDAMERLDLEDNAPDIEVLEGQMSVEELLAELGFEWRPEPGAGEREDEAATAEIFSQPALF
ncbi:hypothetical protein QFZ70_003289 [Arthrobacter sp. V1I9]|jgi:hypothetical protein|nr:hypothetical protein [Arthrobacter sp. V1I9]